MSMLKQRLESARGSSLRCPFVRSAPNGRVRLQWKTGSQAVQRSRADVRVRVAEATTPNLRTGDVYVVEPKPLEEGVEKHIISIFVADEPGLINRVAGVFARRGANIESLAVGLTVDKALFTVVVAGKAATVANLIKQLSKLVKVRYVEDITATNRIERELLLLKLGVQPGPARAEVLQLAQIFRARVVDVSDNTLSLSVTGDPGKLTALLKVMSKFGVVELARTGRICLRRGEDLLERGTNLPEEAEAAAPAGPTGRRHPVGSGTDSESERTADVYAVEEDVSGVWDADNVLAATYAAKGEVPSDFKSYTLNIEVQDVPGVLNQVTQVFARRGYNVQSLVVGPSEREGMSRIVMVVPGRATSPDGSSGISPLLKQLSKLVFVETITDLTDVPYVNRELLLVKVRCSAAQRGELRDLAAIFRGSIVDVSANCLTIEVLGKEDKMKAFTELLQPYGILEIARTGRVAMARDSGVNSEYLERMSMGRVM
ncbi:hypothetical protein VOLCADRAFT_73781 [Volvox carteri f. nagariensis]|uniref:ACT domain-containing protein n=1 Tax=Volvox carteri f. nagariensis TaxID=3068 RepID=D8TQ30_VOLCA|nr:uncharacterized protein VOLCADRAFT_73781 [Volvox carteri f. nagariensis]EFJ50333.1 hypothetical protein VOLCADRAFT_73781 [Volvox carteri f. nagariensis]|eukprot:XP_002948458.1 hypothetical protein VOLCADRAFT_73781 [Volvox carteri f. nagariensis]